MKTEMISFQLEVYIVRTEMKSFQISFQLKWFHFRFHSNWNDFISVLTIETSNWNENWNDFIPVGCLYSKIWNEIISDFIPTEFKEEKYSSLVTDLSRNYSVSLFSVEISARGLVTPANRARIKAFLFKCCTNAKSITKPAISICSKASLLSS